MAATAQSLLRRLNSVKLEDYEADAVKAIEHWKQEIAKAEQFEELAANHLIQEIVKDYQNKTQEINNELINRPGIEKDENQLMHDRKTMYTEIVHRFSPASFYESLAKTIDESL